MRKLLKSKFTLCAICLLLLLSAGCLRSTSSTLSGSSDAQIGTAVAQTVAIQETIYYLETMVGRLTETAQATKSLVPSSSESTTVSIITPASSTPLQPSITPNPPTVTPTQQAATLTPVPPSTSVPTSTPIPCDALQFVTDVTIPDGTVLTAGQSFIKTWRIKNSGACSWTPDYSLVFVSGEALNGPSSVRLNTNVSPGSTIDLSISLVAPSSGGTFTGYWQLRNANGVLFGLGANANRPFWVKIVVSSPTANPHNVINFVEQYCSASWITPLGNLPCPSTTNDFVKGSITRTKKPQFETGYIDDQYTLIMIPTNGTGGLIQGRYPPMIVKTGDEFHAWIGCMYDSENCSVTFELNYIANGGSVQNLGLWNQTYDNSFEEININLDALAGKSVEFLFLVTNNNGSNKDDRAFWLYPRIIR